jgi:hypothetical protein
LELKLKTEEIEKLHERETRLSVHQRLEMRRRYDACMTLLNKAFKVQSSFAIAHKEIDNAESRLTKTIFCIYASLIGGLISVYFTLREPFLALACCLFFSIFLIQLASRISIEREKSLARQYLKNLYAQSDILESEWEIYAPSYPISLLSFEVRNSEKFNENKILLKQKLLELVDMEWEKFFSSYNMYRD